MALTQEQKQKFLFTFERALLAKSKEIPVLQDERVRREITDLALQVLNEMAGTLDLSNLKAQELQSLIEPVIWKVAKALESKLDKVKEELIKNDDQNTIALAEGMSRIIGRGNREVADEIKQEIRSAKEEINKTISDIAYQSQRIW
jgi:actin-like ATPase involved in cell morphogenesis